MTVNVAADQLRLLIERVENLEAEKKALSDDIKDVYGEAKSVGFDTKTIRAIVRERKMEKYARDEAAALLDTYRAALGMDYASTPLGQAAVNRATADVDVVKLAADIHNAGGRMVGGTLVMPMDGLKDAASASDDDLYDHAKALVIEYDKASTSWLQRQLRIGYNQAARLIERMQREGVVSAPDHIGKRNVLANVKSAAA